MNTIELNNYNKIIERIKNSFEMEACTQFAGIEPMQLMSRFYSNALYDEYLIHDFYHLTAFTNEKMFFGTLAVVQEQSRDKGVEKITEFQCFALKELESNYETMLIRPESFQDKMLDLFVKGDIDFPDFPDFSNKYYFIARNKDLAHKFATASRLHLISLQDKIFIEVSGNLLFARFTRKINERDCKKIVEFINLI